MTNSYRRKKKTNTNRPSQGISQSIKSLLFVLTTRRRKFVKERKITATNDYEITYTGNELDNNDLHFYNSILHLLKLNSPNKDCQINVSSSELLKLMDKSDTKKNRDMLKQHITRLSTGVIQVKESYSQYMGRIIKDAIFDEKTHKWAITFSPTLLSLLAPDIQINTAKIYEL